MPRRSQPEGTALRIISAGFIISSVSVTASGALEGLGKGTQSLVISLFRYVILMIPAAFVLCRIFGPTGYGMLSGSPKQSPRSSPLISTIRRSEAENNICQKRGWCFKQTFHFEVISNMPENTTCRFQLELHRIQLFEKNESISSCRRFASDSVSLPRLDSPGVCPTSHRQSGLLSA